MYYVGFVLSDNNAVAAIEAEELSFMRGYQAIDEKRGNVFMIAYPERVDRKVVALDAAKTLNRAVRVFSKVQTFGKWIDEMAS